MARSSAAGTRRSSTIRSRIAKEASRAPLFLSQRDGRPCYARHGTPLGYRAWPTTTSSRCQIFPENLHARRASYKLRDVAANLPNRFKTLKLEGLKGDQLPEYGADVLKDREIVGTLTSPTTSPRYGKIGIAIIRSDLADDGTALEIAFGDGTASATVDVLPIYDPEKERPRA